jgi:hypothetical protein
VQESNKRHLLRFGAILSLAALAVIFLSYIYLDTTSFNEYCRNERGSDEPYDALEAIKFAAIGFGILAFPCLIVRGSFSLKVYVSVSAAMAATLILTLFDASSPPVECFTSGGNTPMNDVILFALGVILIFFVFYVVLVVDIAVGGWTKQKN